MRSFVIGTAGHIDHGKTSLIRALTGIDPDRLEEERLRGITIDLGFAHLEKDGAHLSFVDVPGHERFVRSMVAGATGIDVALLVVAADEGVMPQTREHLDVLRLLGLRSGVVAITKADLLPELGVGWETLVHEELDALLAGSFLQDAPRISVSARSGLGLDALLTALVEGARGLPGRWEDGPLYLPIDRAFPIRGFGTVVTGTIHSGTLREGDLVDLVPGGPAKARVRGLQSHGKPVGSVHAGQRAAVNLAGVTVPMVSRGMVLSHAGKLPAGSILDVELEFLADADRPLRNRERLVLHVGTAQAPAMVVLPDVAELAPGERAPAQLRLPSRIAALPSQRFLLRGSSSLPGRGKTLGGGRILAILPPRLRRGGSAERWDVLLHGSEGLRLETLLFEAGSRGLDVEQASLRLALPLSLVQRLLREAGSRGMAVCHDRDRGAWLSLPWLRRLVEKSGGWIRAHHEARPLSPGLPLEELRRRLSIEDGRVFAHLLSRLERERWTVADDVIREKDFRPGAEEKARSLEHTVLELITANPLSPPEVEEISRQSGEKQEKILAVLRLLEAKGEVIRVARNLYFESKAVEGLRRSLVRRLLESGEISTQEFKGLAKTSRKWLIPLGEHFDAEKVTLRTGNATRILRGDRQAWARWLEEAR